MEILLESLGPGVHCYSPFNKSVPSPQPNLSERCKNVILQSVTLRRLYKALQTLPLPKPLLRFIADLTTADFDKIECAPFSDAFSLNFLHRALTYRVVCLRDDLEYMMTYAYCPIEKPKLQSDQNKWVAMQHKNVMSICATVTDMSTNNVFYVYDRPHLSLDQMWTVFCSRKQPFPDLFFQRVAADLCEGLEFILQNGLQYDHFWLDNVFLVEDRLVLENALMRKRLKKEYINETNVICHIISILKYLTKNHEQSESLQNLITQIEAEKSLDKVLDLVKNSAQNIHSFSFLKLVQTLKS